jgi:hypothetical protein
MSANIPPKMRPLNFNDPIVNKDGKMTPEWQQHMQALQQRLEGPVSSTAPATSASPGIPLSLATDGNFLYLNLGNGSWKRITLVAF